MIPEELEKTILMIQERGDVPLMVNQTTGTTAQGVIDPI